MLPTVLLQQTNYASESVIKLKHHYSPLRPSALPVAETYLLITRQIIDGQTQNAFPVSGLERLQQLLEALASAGHVIRTNVYRVTDASDAYRTLRQLDSRSRDGKKILLDLPTRETELLLRKVVININTARPRVQSL